MDQVNFKFSAIGICNWLVGYIYLKSHGSQFEHFLKFFEFFHISHVVISRFWASQYRIIPPFVKYLHQSIDIIFAKGMFCRIGHV